MVLVNIKKEEIEALDRELYGKSKCLIPSGLVLGLLRVRIQEALNAEKTKLQKEQAKVILGVKKKD